MSTIKRKKGDGTFEYLGLGSLSFNEHIASSSNPHAVTKTQVGLGSVDNIQQLPLSYLSIDGTFASNSDTKVPSEKAIKTYVTANTFPTGIQGNIVYHNGTVWATLPPGISGQVLSTNGASANPSWATVSGSLPSGIQGNIIYHTGSAWATLAPGSDTQYLKGGTTPSWATPSSSGGGITWNAATTNTTAVVDNGYYCTASTLVTITAPASFTAGKTIRVSGYGTGMWKFALNSGQTAYDGYASATTYIAATGQYDAVEFLAVATNVVTVLSKTGALEVV